MGPSQRVEHSESPGDFSQMHTPSSRSVLSPLGRQAASLQKDLRWPVFSGCTGLGEAGGNTELAAIRVNGDQFYQNGRDSV